MKLSQLPDSMKPREKALTYGFKVLTDAELMAIIFATGIKGKNVLELCGDILADNGHHISKVAAMDVRTITTRYKGIGPAKALTLLAALELGSRAAADALTVERRQMLCSRDAFEYMKQYLLGLDHEEFWILLLRNNLLPIRAVRIGQGGITGAAVDVKMILREALLANAPAIMLFHNHPSGNLEPSTQDDILTHKIVDAAKTLDIRVPDHIILGSHSYYSYNDHGKM